MSLNAKYMKNSNRAVSIVNFNIFLSCFKSLNMENDYLKSITSTSDGGVNVNLEELTPLSKDYFL